MKSVYVLIEEQIKSNSGKTKITTRKKKEERKLASLAKWLSVRLRTKWLWVRVPLQPFNLQTWRLFGARGSLTISQLYRV